MSKQVKIASYVNIIANTIILVINLSIGLIFASISILSKALDSIFDLFNAAVIHYTIKINNLKADDCHQFGHSRAENIAGYTTGILMIILSFAIIKISFEKIISKQILEYSYLMLVAVIVTFVIKFCLYFYVKSVLKNHQSPALKANMTDHLNDLFVIFGVFIAIIGLKYGYPILDPVIGIMIATIVFRNGLITSKDNLKYLMGYSADKKIIEKIEKKALETKGVEGVNEIKTQYLGNKIQVEIHIDINSKIALHKAHDIGVEVKREIEKMHDIINCFVHIDPIEDIE